MNVQIVHSVKRGQTYALPKDLSIIFGRKSLDKLLKAFREYADGNESKFYPYKPYIKQQGLDTLYNIVSFAFYLENKDLLEAGTRSITFEDERERLEEVYG